MKPQEWGGWRLHQSFWMLNESALLTITRQDLNGTQPICTDIFLIHWSTATRGWGADLGWSLRTGYSGGGLPLSPRSIRNITGVTAVSGEGCAVHSKQGDQSDEPHPPPSGRGTGCYYFSRHFNYNWSSVQIQDNAREHERATVCLSVTVNKVPGSYTPSNEPTVDHDSASCAGLWEGCSLSDGLSRQLLLLGRLTMVLFHSLLFKPPCLPDRPYSAVLLDGEQQTWP